jgi:hypothetical protein
MDPRIRSINLSKVVRNLTDVETTEDRIVSMQACVSVLGMHHLNLTVVGLNPPTQTSGGTMLRRYRCRCSIPDTGLYKLS